MSRRKPPQHKVIESFRLVHGNRYDYSLVEYKGAGDKIEIICTKCHNVFWQAANNHKKGQGCPICCRASNIKFEKVNISKFIDDCCKELEISKETLLKKNAKPIYVNLAKKAICFILKDQASISIISENLNFKDTTLFSHQYNKAVNLMKTDKYFRDIYKRLNDIKRETK